MAWIEWTRLLQFSCGSRCCFFSCICKQQAIQHWYTHTNKFVLQEEDSREAGAAEAEVKIHNYQILLVKS